MIDALPFALIPVPSTTPLTKSPTRSHLHTGRTTTTRRQGCFSNPDNPPVLLFSPRPSTSVVDLPTPHHPKHINMAGALARLCTRAWRSSSTALSPRVGSLSYPYVGAAAPATALLVRPISLSYRASPSPIQPHTHIPTHAYVYLLDLLALCFTCRKSVIAYRPSYHHLSKWHAEKPSAQINRILTLPTPPFPHPHSPPPPPPPPPTTPPLPTWAGKAAPRLSAPKRTPLPPPKQAGVGPPPAPAQEAVPVKGN